MLFFLVEVEDQGDQNTFYSKIHNSTRANLNIMHYILKIYQPQTTILLPYSWWSAIKGIFSWKLAQ